MQSTVNRTDLVPNLYVSQFNRRAVELGHRLVSFCKTTGPSTKSCYSPKRLDISPCLRGVLIQARWVKCESVEAAITSQPILRKSSARSENAIISVGHTNVLQRDRYGYSLCHVRRLLHISSQLGVTDISHEK